MDPAPLLEVRDLKKHFPIKSGVFKRRTGSVFAVDGVSFSVNQGETLGLVGESGCGKTTVGRCVIRLYEPTAGEVIFDGKSVTHMARPELRHLRRDMQMIFQDPYESLNARQTVGNLLEEPFVIHKMGTPAERTRKVAELLDKVGMPASAANRFPHEFSGGQRQRIGIARAIALNPKLVVCDEPVSALDVSIQSQILNLMLFLQKQMGLSYIFIAHDLSVVHHVSDRIAVMYLGRIVEYADAGTLYASPLHPYTRALISAIPMPDPEHVKKKKPLGGDVPSPVHPPAGCHFHPRCPLAIDICRNLPPKLEPQPASGAENHLAACHRAGEK